MFAFNKSQMDRLEKLKSSVHFSVKVGAQGQDSHIATLIDKYQGRRWFSAVASSKEAALELVLTAADPNLAPRTPAEQAIDLIQSKELVTELMGRLKSAGEQLQTDLIGDLAIPSPRPTQASIQSAKGEPAVMVDPRGQATQPTVHATQPVSTPVVVAEPVPPPQTPQAAAAPVVVEGANPQPLVAPAPAIPNVVEPGVQATQLLPASVETPVLQQGPRTAAELRELAMGGPPDVSAYMHMDADAINKLLAARGLAGPEGSPGSSDWKREAGEAIVNYDLGIA